MRVTVALVGLLGVAVGGVITWAVEFFFERRREQADLRQAKRLIAEELQTVWIDFDNLARDRRTPTSLVDPEAFLPTQAWQAHKATLARHLSDREWQELPLVAHAAGRLRVIYLGGERGRALTSEDVKWCADLRDAASRVYTSITGRPVET
jgi:hypothetical protein